MLRITRVRQTSSDEAYALEGWLVDEQVRVLAETCGGALERGARLILDLEGVRFIDDAGLTLLQRWAEQGLRLHRASDFVGQLLAAYGLRCQETGDESE